MGDRISSSNHEGLAHGNQSHSDLTRRTSEEADRNTERSLEQRQQYINELKEQLKDRLPNTSHGYCIKLETLNIIEQHLPFLDSHKNLLDIKEKLKLIDQLDINKLIHMNNNEHATIFNMQYTAPEA